MKPTITLYERTPHEDPLLVKALKPIARQFVDNSFRKVFHFSGDTVVVYHYAGIIRAGNYLVEVLPKIDKDKPSPTAARQVLTRLLALQPESLHSEGEASTGLQSDTPLVPFISAYLQVLSPLSNITLWPQIPAKRLQQEGNIGPFYLDGHGYDKYGIPLNELIEAALIELLSMDLSPTLSRQVTETLDRISGGHVPINRPLPALARRKVSHDPTSGLKDPFRTAAEWTLRILHTLWPDLYPREHASPGLMLDTEQLWEKALLNLCNSRLGNCWHLDKERSLPFWGSKKQHVDGLLHHSSGKRIIIECKWLVYKDSPDIDHLRQVLSYLIASNAHAAIIIVPTLGSTGYSWEEEFFGTSGLKGAVLQLTIGNPDAGIEKVACDLERYLTRIMR